MRLACALALLAASACAPARPGPPEIVVDRTACSHCGMLISEPIYAAAYRAGEAEGRTFDDIGCLLDAASRETATGLRFWFHDAATGEWIDGDAASFVKGAAIRTPMSGGIIAFRDRGAAERAAGAQRATLVPSLAGLTHSKGDQP